MRCPDCPVRAGLACLGERHRPVCGDVAAGMPGRASQLVALAEGGPLPPSIPDHRPLVPLAESLAIARAIRECPSRVPPSCGCPDVAATCTRPDQPFGRSPIYPECQSCVSARTPPGDPP